MKSFAARRPLVFTILVMVVLEVFVLAAVSISKLAGIDILAIDMPILLLNALVAIVLLSLLGWWGNAGFNTPSNWKNLHLLLVPIVLLVGPTLFLQPQFPGIGKMFGLFNYHPPHWLSRRGNLSRDSAPSA